VHYRSPRSSHNELMARCLPEGTIIEVGWSGRVSTTGIIRRSDNSLTALEKRTDRVGYRQERRAADDQKKVILRSRDVLLCY